MTPLQIKLLKPLAILIASLGLFLGGFFYGKGKAPPAPPAIVQTVEVVKEVVVEKKAEVRERIVWKDKEGNTVEKEVVSTVVEHVAQLDTSKEHVYEKLFPKYIVGALINPLSPKEYSVLGGYIIKGTQARVVGIVSYKEKKFQSGMIGLTYEL